MMHFMDRHDEAESVMSGSIYYIQLRTACQCVWIMDTE